MRAGKCVTTLRSERSFSKSKILLIFFVRVPCDSLFFCDMVFSQAQLADVLGYSGAVTSFEIRMMTGKATHNFSSWEMFSCNGGMVFKS